MRYIFIFLSRWIPRWMSYLAPSFYSSLLPKEMGNRSVDLGFRKAAEESMVCLRTGARRKLYEETQFCFKYIFLSLSPDINF